MTYSAASAPGQVARDRIRSPLAAAAGRPAPVASPGATRTPFLVVSMHKVRDRSAGIPARWLPYGVEHAWQPGTRMTLCGQWMGDWSVFWDRSFVVTAADACPDCVEATLPPDSRSRLDPRRPGT